MKGTYVERDRKKEKKKVKVVDTPGTKKVPGAAAAMGAGVPAAMPVSKRMRLKYLHVRTVSSGCSFGYKVSNKLYICCIFQIKLQIDS